jgi:hypothetical protein
VDAQPTKDFFVSMLVRDVDLLDAVIDLLDNSVDGARRRRPDGDYSGLAVKLSFSEEHFRIEDNCGGIPLETARRYAFRFGRDTSNPADPRSIGQFGVGMKRTLFKLGRSFRVVSRTAEDSFVLEVVVPAWLREERWDFELVTPAENSGGEASIGTVIEASDLTQSTQADLADPAWEKRLAEGARLKHRRALDRGLDITVKGRRLEPMPLDLSQGKGIEPAVERLVLEGGGVTVLLLAGVSEPDASDAGWYIFCNDRLVLGPDKSRVTVWRGAGRQARGGVPNYHDQYSRFRGYALFEAVDPALLPWTTTKTGIDADSPVWRATRPHMERITRPVIDFLNLLDKERTAVEGDARRGQPGLLDEDEELQAELVSAAVEQAPRVGIDDVIADAGDWHEAREFRAPRVDFANLPVPRAWIRYAAEANEVRTARRLMGGGTERDLPNGEVGRRAFEYYLTSEGE